MDRYTLLFQAIASLIPKGFHITFGSLVEDPEKHPNAIGISFKGGTPSHRSITTGRYNMRAARVVMNIVTAPAPTVKNVGGTNYKVSADAKKSVSKGREAVEEFLNKIETLSNYTYTDKESGDSVRIVLTQTLGDLNQLGFNGNGQPFFSVNFTINYV